jgi:cyclopropane fatty-acyl-phospholipid synthase-like methyltransferase
VGVIADTISSRLALSKADDVLELCCGNGVVTVAIAPRCRTVTAVDFSEPLIATARRDFSAGNVSYVVGDVTALDEKVLARRFDKIFMQEALQHFTMEQIDRLFSMLAASPSRTAPLFIGAIPDAARLRNFYDTSERYRQYLDSLRKASEPIGTWWRKNQLRSLAVRHGYRPTLFHQHPALHTAHYRLDLLCEPCLG